MDLMSPDERDPVDQKHVQRSRCEVEGGAVHPLTLLQFY